MNTAIRVLMVDDEVQFRMTTEKILNRKGFTTILAASGEEAIEKLDQDPEVVVLDIRMPGMDGMETLKKIKDRKPDISVIMLTGHGEKFSAETAYQSGACDYLTKPCDVDLLAARITDAVKRRKYPPDGEERSVGDVMIPISDYTTIQSGQSVREAIQKLMDSFSSGSFTNRLLEIGHRSVLVLDESGKTAGMLSIAGLLNSIMPAYLSAPKPSTADSMEYSPMFWRGMFSSALKELSPRKVSEIMSPAPQAIDLDANLMEAAYQMVKHNMRRLIVMQNDQIAGIVREQDLFFVMEKILRES